MIELVDVWKRFGRVWILRGVNMNVRRSTLIAIVGENGSGKTTLLKIICGLIKPTRGSVKILGRDIRKDSTYKYHVGILFHENVLYDELTVHENLIFYSRMYGFKDLNDLARNVFKRLNLERYRDVKVRDLSYGWRKRVNFVRALVNDPEIILLDEPLSGLDETARNTILDLLSDLSNERVVIMTSPTELDVECRTFHLMNGVLA